MIKVRTSGIARIHISSDKGADPKARAEAKAGLASARTRLAEVIERIQRESKAAAHVLYPQAPTREVLARVLAPDEALILYALLAEVATALVVTAEQARIVPLGKTSLIVEAAEALKLSAPEGEPKAAILGLRKLIIAPLTLGPAVRRLLISPDGILSYAPFPLLAEAHEVVLVPSGATLAALRNEHAPRGEGVLALGNPDYGVVVPEPPGRLVQRDRKLLALPGSEEEARAIGSVVLLGKDATESGLRAALARKPRWRAVHLACHGLLERDRPMLSSLALTPEGEDDGRWTALDVFRTRVPTDLAFLSACETGKGKLVEGEGLVGLTRAFLFAGAPRVIASLWRVDDEATKALVVAFYERWGVAGTTVVQALREAQAVVRSQERWEHPYFWAAWELWGLPE